MLSYVKIAVIGAVAAAAFSLAIGIYNSGGKAVQDEIDKQNADALSDAIDSADSFDRCDDAGGVFDFRTGKCRRAGAGNRN